MSSSSGGNGDVFLNALNWLTRDLTSNSNLPVATHLGFNPVGSSQRSSFVSKFGGAGRTCGTISRGCEREVTGGRNWIGAYSVAVPPSVSHDSKSQRSHGENQATSAGFGEGSHVPVREVVFKQNNRILCNDGVSTLTVTNKDSKPKQSVFA